MAHNIADLKDNQKINPSQLGEKLEKKEVIVIDVRNPPEREENGYIEGSINIPFPGLENALNLSNEVFKKEYGVDKPSTDGEGSVVFHCQHGGRGSRSVLLANKVGLNNAQNLDGGYAKWSSEKAA